MSTVLDVPRRPSPETPAPSLSARSAFVPRSITALLVIGPGVALVVALIACSHAVHLRDVGLAIGFYVLSGFGVTVGYYRLFTHRSFRPKRWLKLALAAGGSLAMEGTLVSWVATHRRHHRLSDAPGDPHSPHAFGPGLVGPLRGFVHAHVGWLFRSDPTSETAYASDLLRDNLHHAHPASARHGALPHQIDPSAMLIRLFERAGWATKVRWPTTAQLASCAPAGA